MASDEEEIIYSDEESDLLNSNGEDDGMTWEIDWDNMVCVDEYGDDGDIPTAKMSSDSSSDDEFNDIELDAVDELDSVSDGEKRDRSDDEKKESEKEEGDPWSRWVGMKNEEEEEEKMNKEKKKEGMNVKREERRRDEKTKKEMKREDNRRNERNEKRLTLAEKVLMGKMREDDAKRDTMNRFDGRSPPVLSRRSRIDDRKMKMNSSRDRRSLPIDSMMMEKRSESKERRIVSPSHDRRKERSPRRIPSPLMKKEEEERRRHSSPLRKERRVSPSRREKRTHVKNEDRRRMERSPERRRETHRGHLPNRESIIRDRCSIPHKGDSIPSNHRVSSSNRCITRRSRSPMGRKREENPNLVKIGERKVFLIVSKEISPRREERPPSPKIIPRKELPSLLDVKILTPHSRMDGRVKRMEMEDKDQDEDKPKEIIVKDGRDEKKKEMMTAMKMKMPTTSSKETIEEEKKEERKRHVPIVWNDKETDAKKMHRSIGHMEGIETIERRRKEEEMKEEAMDRKMRLEKVGDAVIPASMAARVAKFSLDEKDKVTPVVFPPLSGVEQKKSLDPPLPRFDPSNVVRTIVNKGVVTRQPVKAIEKKSVQMEEEKEEGACVGTVEDEDEGGWLSTKLQHGGNGIHKESSTRVHRMKNDPSSAAFRLLCRATASAVSSSNMKDVPKKEMHSPINGPDLFGEKKGEKNKKNMVENRLAERIEKRRLEDSIGKKKRKNKPSNEVPSSDIPHLLESYF